MEAQPQYTATPTFDQVFQGFVPFLKSMAQDAMKEAAAAGSESVIGQVKKAFKTQTVEMVDSFIQRSGVQELKEKVGRLPAEIKAKKQETDNRRAGLRDLRKRFTEAEQALKNAELEAIGMIAADKSSYPNDNARKAALNRYKQEDAGYLDLLDIYSEAKQVIDSEEFDISLLDAESRAMENDFHATCKLLDAVVGEINIYAAAIGAVSR